MVKPFDLLKSHGTSEVNPQVVLQHNNSQWLNTPSVENLHYLAAVLSSVNLMTMHGIILPELTQTQ